MKYVLSIALRVSLRKCVGLESKRHFNIQHVYESLQHQINQKSSLNLFQLNHLLQFKERDNSLFFTNLLKESSIKMFNHESFISVEKCLISTDLEIPNPCNEIDQNYTSETILANINKGIHVKKIDDFEEIFDFLLIKSIDLSFNVRNI